MATPKRTKELKALYGDLEQVIVPLVNQGGQRHAADVLGTSISYISTWLKDNGYYVRNVWVKVGSEEEAAYLESEGL